MQNVSEECRGRCLEQTQRKNNYSRRFLCAKNCQPIKCPNYQLCGTADPQWVLDAHRGRCLNCDIGFGRDLTFVEVEEECTICLETQQMFINMPGCSHRFCVTCFGNIYGGNQIIGTDPHVLGEGPDSPYVSEDEEDDDEAYMSDPELPAYASTCPLCRNRPVPDWQKKRKLD